MARVIKIDNALQKKFAKTEKKRNKEGVKELRVYFLIVCEGEKTEPNYFKSFPKNTGTFVIDLSFEGGGISTTKVVEEAIKSRDKSAQKFDRVWAVFDKDSFLPSNFNAAIAKAASNNIECAWSNEAFELWYLLHFQNRITAMPRDQYQKAIEKAINDKVASSSSRKNVKESFKYKKNALDMYDKLAKYGNQKFAIKWARDLCKQHEGGDFSTQNPCTLVCELVEQLIGESKKLNEEIIAKYRQEI